MVNIGKYAIHGWYGLSLEISASIIANSQGCDFLRRWREKSSWTVRKPNPIFKRISNSR